MLINEIDAAGLDDDLRAVVGRWGISNLTQIQVLALQAGIADGSSQFVCAPTSSGKTLVGEIAILAALRRRNKCLYLVSHKALADQKYVDFTTRFGDGSIQPGASVGLSTGDRDEGEVAPQVLVATYEKALALLLSGQLNPSAMVVVADELQILGEDSRGPNIETLCAILRQQPLAQFVALTATIGNASDMANWLRCTPVVGYERDVELHQEIWNDGVAYRVRFGQEEGERCHVDEDVPSDALDVVRRLVLFGLGPVLMFTESRNEARILAEEYSQSLARTADGIALADQLELFSEPTESSEQLQESAQKRVAFHTADLTAQERQVIESGFAESNFDVCFATSTLAAGVNFPFRSVVFPKLTYQYGDRAGTMITRSDYRNMSGRAGRLGLHDDGYAVLLPKTRQELAHGSSAPKTNAIICPENDSIESGLVGLSMRRTVLALVSFGAVNARDVLAEFFKHSFYWHQLEEKTQRSLTMSSRSPSDQLIG